VKGRFLCATRLRQGELVEPYEIIEAEEANFPVALMCRQLSVSRSGYYKWKVRKPSWRQKEDQKLKVAIKASHTASRGTYGSPRIVDDLREQGFEVSRRRVARLMAEEGITGTPKRPYKRTTDSKHGTWPLLPAQPRGIRSGTSEPRVGCTVTGAALVA
jgi:putative transposase